MLKGLSWKVLSKDWEHVSKRSIFLNFFVKWSFKNSRYASKSKHCASRNGMKDESSKTEGKKLQILAEGIPSFVNCNIQTVRQICPTFKIVCLKFLELPKHIISFKETYWNLPKKKDFYWNWPVNLFAWLNFALSLISRQEFSLGCVCSLRFKKLMYTLYKYSERDVSAKKV